MSANTYPLNKFHGKKAQRSAASNIVVDAFYCLAMTFAVFNGLGLPEDVRARAGIRLNH
jgi:hypothetical protein